MSTKLQHRQAQRIANRAFTVAAALLLATGGPANAQGWLKELVADKEIPTGDFLPVEQAFPFIATEQQPSSNAKDIVTLQLHWDVAPDYYLYRRSFALKASNANIVSSKLPAGVVVDDLEYGFTEVYETAVTLETTLQATSSDPIQLSVQYQGCAKAGLCYPPSVAHYTLTTNVLATDIGKDQTGPIAVRTSNDLKQYIGSGLPVLVEVSADWSAASQLMERRLFKHKATQQALKNVLWLRADVSDIDSPDSELLLKELNAAGPPAFRFYQATGEPITELKHDGRINREQLINSINATPAVSWPTN